MTIYTACTVSVSETTGTTALLLTRYEPGPVRPGGPDRRNGRLAAWQQLLLPDSASLKDVRDELERHGYTADRDEMLAAARRAHATDKDLLPTDALAARGSDFTFRIVPLPVTGIVTQLADLPAAERLAALHALPAEVDVMMRAAVAELRAAGTSWQAIGDILGVSRQTVHERFAKG